MLTKEQKKEFVKKLKEKFDNNKLAVFCNFEGISVTRQRGLKKQFKENDGQLFVAKRRLLQKALLEEKVEMSDIAGSIMIGLTPDEVLPAKIINAFKLEKKEKIEFVGGILKGDDKFAFLTKEEVEEIAKLPSREEILARLVGVLKAPLSNLSFVLNENMRKLAYILANISSE